MTEITNREFTNILSVDVMFARMKSLENTVFRLENKLQALEKRLTNKKLDIISNYPNVRVKTDSHAVKDKKQYYVIISIINDGKEIINSKDISLICNFDIPPIEIISGTITIVHGNYQLFPANNIKSGERLTITCKFAGTIKINYKIIGFTL